MIQASSVEVRQLVCQNPVHNRMVGNNSNPLSATIEFMLCLSWHQGHFCLSLYVFPLNWRWLFGGFELFKRELIGG